MVPTRPNTILVVDDSAAIRTVVCTILEEAGYSVAGAGGSDAATATVRAACPDLAIIDLQISGASGLELGGNLGALCPDMRVFYMSGHDVAAALPEGTEFLSKPFRPAELLEKVKKVFS